MLVLTIYATVGLAQSLADSLLERGLLDDFFGFSFLLIIAAIVLQGIKVRPTGKEIGIIIGIAAIYLLVFVRILSPAERSHLIEYSIISLLIHEALLERVKNGKPVPYAALVAIILTTLAGVLDECIQFFVPGRHFDSFDILFDFLAALMAVGGSSILQWIRIRVKQARAG